MTFLFVEHDMEVVMDLGRGDRDGGGRVIAADRRTRCARTSG